MDHPEFSDVVQPIPRSPYAPGEISPVISTEVSYLGTAPDGLSGDSQLMSLLSLHREAIVAYEAADEACAGPLTAFRDGRPPRPEALYWRASDRGQPASRTRVPGIEGSRLLVYIEEDVKLLRAKPATTTMEHRRPAPWDPDETIIRTERLPDTVGEARRLEIIAAWDGWKADEEALRESTGLNAANDALDAAGAAADTIEDAILATSPHTIEGLLAKARWISDRPRSALFLDPLFRDLCAALPAGVPRATGDDHALLSAIAEFRRVDEEITALCLQHHCDTDCIPGYAEAEAAWWCAVADVANLPAQSWSGIVAKADLMKKPSVWYDSERSISFGDSLAEDVLRLAGLAWDPKTAREELKKPEAAPAEERAA